MTVKIFAFVSFGMGGANLDPTYGERYLVERLKAIGVDTLGSPYNWNNVQAIYDAVLKIPVGNIICGGGDSLGANEAPAIAAYLNGKRIIDYLFGFQRSTWGGEQCGVPANVIAADSIYNPGAIGFLRTLGMGSDPWTLAAGNTKTKLRNIAINAPHPDDFGTAQDIIFAKIHALKTGTTT